MVRGQIIQTITYLIHGAGWKHLTLNMKLGDAYEKMLKILPTSYLQPCKEPPTENPISDDNDDDKDKCF